MDTATPRDHLHNMKDSLKHAADAVADRLVGDDVRSHLHQAGRELLLAGIAAIDHAERHRAARRAERHAVTPVHAPHA